MRKTILALITIFPLAAVLAQEPQAPILVHGARNPDENKAPGNPLANYGAGPKARHEAAVAAFQAAYEAASGLHGDRAIRLFLLSLRREPAPKTLYDLAVVCARDERWDDALSFQREAQQQAADPEVSKLAASEIERLQTIQDLESTPAGKLHRKFDMRFMQVLKARSQYASLNELKLLTNLDNTRWEAPALAGILYAEVHNFQDSLTAFENAARLAPPDRGGNLRKAADLARREANFNEQRISADELWEKQQYEQAAEHYAAAWESSPKQLEIGLQAATGYLMADQVEPAVRILSRMRASATGEMDDRIGAMLKELGAVSDEAKRAARGLGASGATSAEETSASMRKLVGNLTSREMELAARADPPLLDDKTRIVAVPDDEIYGTQAGLPLLSTDSIYALYKRDQPAPSAPPAPAEPAANPGSPPSPAPLPPAPAKPAPLAALPPPPATESAHPSAVARRVPGDLPVPVTSDPPGALVTFGDDDNLNCTAPCQVSLSTGRHPWRATLAGYRDALGVYNIEKGKKPPAVIASLEAKRGFVSVESKIAGLPIFLNGQKTDSRTPAQLKLMEGTYQLAVEIDGKLVTEDITVRDGGLLKITF